MLCSVLLLLRCAGILLIRNGHSRILCNAAWANNMHDSALCASICRSGLSIVRIPAISRTALCVSTLYLYLGLTTDVAPSQTRGAERSLLEILVTKRSACANCTTQVPHHCNALCPEHHLAASLLSSQPRRAHLSTTGSFVPLSLLRLRRTY